MKSPLKKEIYENFEKIFFKLVWKETLFQCRVYQSFSSCFTKWCHIGDCISPCPPITWIFLLYSIIPSWSDAKTTAFTITFVTTCSLSKSWVIELWTHIDSPFLLYHSQLTTWANCGPSIFLSSCTIQNWDLVEYYIEGLRFKGN